MQTQRQTAEAEQAETKAKIAALRESYARLRAICGPQGISRETKAEYADKIAQLQTQLN
jgi:3-deoxy-D-arabino-heptulosonate 7-phosphate (DAHP) synthase